MVGGVRGGGWLREYARDQSLASVINHAQMDNEYATAVFVKTTTHFRKIVIFFPRKNPWSKYAHIFRRKAY